eukprot:scaffold735_cov116-Cylindrotheca_fusiformis.AAC.23
MRGTIGWGLAYHGRDGAGDLGQSGRGNHMIPLSCHRTFDSSISCITPCSTGTFAGLGMRMTSWPGRTDSDPRGNKGKLVSLASNCNTLLCVVLAKYEEMISQEWASLGHFEPREFQTCQTDHPIYPSD